MTAQQKVGRFGVIDGQTSEQIADVNFTGACVLQPLFGRGQPCCIATANHNGSALTGKTLPAGEPYALRGPRDEDGFSSQSKIHHNSP